LRLLAMRALEHAGYRAVGAAHGREALQLVQGGVVKPAVIVTDVVMPELGGIELAERLAVVAPGVRILFVSGYAPQSDHALPKGSFLAKPYSAESLAAAVAGLIAAARPAG
jgi:two-component system, cell cycle sensor histidine kinase and response regulator CckA